MKINYQKRIVAFIDVLGFSEIIFSSNQKPIELYFSYLEESLQEMTTKNKLDFYYISDSIIISALDEKENLLKIVDSIRVIQAQLLSKKILVRGGISVGDLCLDKTKNIIVGPALVKSYKLEGLAKTPRIIIDRELIKYLNFTSTSEFINYFHRPDLHRIINLDADNFLYVDYISYFCTRRQNFTTKKAMENVYELLQSSFFSNSHLEKYSWVAIKIIRELEKQLTMIQELAPIGEGARSQRRTFRKHIPIWLKKFREV